KEVMAQRGAFDGVDAAMMVHPAGTDMVTMPCIAASWAEVAYRGKTAHAAAMPQRGVNALDALVTAYQAVAQLRQQIKGTDRMHAMIIEGGQAINIIHERAVGLFGARSADMQGLAKLKARMNGCFQAGAIASGCEVEITWDRVDFVQLKTNWPMAEAYQANAEMLGREFISPEVFPAGAAGSTDMGNISHRVPSIHPMIAAAPPNVVIHNPEFTKWAKSEKGDKAAIDGAKALAMTALDYLTNEQLRVQAKAEFESSEEDSRFAVEHAWNPKGDSILAKNIGTGIGCGCGAC
ncbi:MAG: peptidase dimerization domain-containing protein, partial [Pseudomonadota bacterium]